MKVMKRGLLMLVVLLFGVGSVRLAYAAPVCDNTDELPNNATYSFQMVGSDVITVHDVPTSAFTGTFATAAMNVSGASFFNVTGGSFVLNDDGNICTGSFAGTGSCQFSQITSGTMNLTLSNLVDVTPGGCTTIDSATPTGALTLYYGLFNSQKGMYLMDLDTNTYSIVGEAQAQSAP
jgi:hypothetical protein